MHIYTYQALRKYACAKETVFVCENKNVVQSRSRVLFLPFPRGFFLLPPQEELTHAHTHSECLNLFSSLGVAGPPTAKTHPVSGFSKTYARRFQPCLYFCPLSTQTQEIYIRWISMSSPKDANSVYSIKVDACIRGRERRMILCNDF